ncbi:MAG: hypothetical protein WCJ62_00345 [Flavobacterium sp.]
MEKVKQHLIMLGIPAILWITAFALDPIIHNKKVSGMIFCPLFLGYAIFANIIAKKQDQKSPLRIYGLLGLFFFLITLSLTFK